VRAHVEHEWFPNHVIEATTRESYRYILDRYLLLALGDLRMADVLPNEVPQWIARFQDPLGVNPPTILKCKIVLDAILTTAPMWSAAVFLPARPMRRISRQGFVGVAQKAQDRVHANPALELS
jgi:hypothetical protein